MNALVTGGTGFIGGHVVDLLLEEGHDVRLFSRKSEIPERIKAKNIQIAQGNLEDFPSLTDAMKDIEVFYHIGEIKNTSRSAARKNVALIEHIIATLKEKKVKRLVFVSSLSVAGIPSEIYASEDTEPEIILEDHYTSCKRTCEMLMKQNISGADYSIIRPAPVYGPRSRYLGRLITLVEKLGPVGFPFIGNARAIAPLIEIKDLAQAIYHAGIKPDAANQSFNITDGLRHTWYDFLNAIAKALGKTLRILPFPPLLLRFPAIFLDLFSGIFGRELDLKNYTTFFSTDILFSNSKAKELLDWEPHSFDLVDGIESMVQAYKGKHT